MKKLHTRQDIKRIVKNEKIQRSSLRKFIIYSHHKCKHNGWSTHHELQKTIAIDNHIKCQYIKRCDAVKSVKVEALLDDLGDAKSR